MAPGYLTGVGPAGSVTGTTAEGSTTLHVRPRSYTKVSPDPDAAPTLAP
jgi:hypothetical protein